MFNLIGFGISVFEYMNELIAWLHFAFRPRREKRDENNGF